MTNLTPIGMIILLVIIISAIGLKILTEMKNNYHPEACKSHCYHAYLNKTLSYDEELKCYDRCITILNGGDNIE